MRSRFMVSAVLAAAVLGGCKKEDTNATNPGGAATKPSATKPATQPAVGAVIAPVIDAAGSEAAVNKQLNEIGQALGAENYDKADKLLKDLEGRKASLPAGAAASLPSLRMAVDAGKKPVVHPPTTAPAVH